MIKIGITGGIGSGKSTVTNMLKDKGLPIVDADIVAREIFILYPKVLSQIKGEFGEEFFDEEGKLLRKELGNYIFKKDSRRRKLEDIVIPYIIKEIQFRLKAYEEENCELCFLDAPTLIENNLHSTMDVTILVWVNSEVQIQRVMQRDALDLNETMNRINAQMSLEEKKKFADFIIDNGGSVGNTESQLNLIIKQLERLNGEQ